MWPARLIVSTGPSSGMAALVMLLGMCDPRGEAREGRGSDFIEAEPSWPGNRRCVGVRRDDFKVDEFAECKQAVVRAHTGVCPAGARLDTESLVNETRAHVE